MKLTCTLLLIICSQLLFSQSKNVSVYFDYNKFELTTQSISTLDSVLALQPINFSLAGFCDSVGKHSYNDQLSINRINAVKNYLINKQIDSTNIIDEQGFGKRKPLNNNATAAERAVNRRVDILFQLQKPVAVVQPSIIEKTIQDSAVKLGANIVLPNFNFIGGRHILLPASMPYQAELLAVLKKYPTLKIEIQGHICCVFDNKDGYDFDDQTYNLSVTRAKSIYTYLVNNGIDATRLSYKGYGSTRPKVYPEKDEADATANRRVEIKIIAK